MTSQMLTQTHGEVLQKLRRKCQRRSPSRTRRAVKKKRKRRRMSELSSAIKSMRPSETHRKG